MSLILLADDSPHAQRMGARILGEEGYRVACAADTEAALAQLTADPDIVIADVSLPGGGGVELCRRVRSSRGHTRVILTAGTLEPFDEAAARAAGCGAWVKKPFEATELLDAVRPLAQEAERLRLGGGETRARELEALVRQAVEAEMPRLVQEITAKVLAEIEKEGAARARA